jgi:hypothetical protein
MARRKSIGATIRGMTIMLPARGFVPNGYRKLEVPADAM